MTQEELAELDRCARAYGYEIGRGQPIAPSVESTEGNPFMDPNWRDKVCVPDEEA